VNIIELSSFLSEKVSFHPAVNSIFYNKNAIPAAEEPFHSFKGLFINRTGQDVIL
jgi:hypothetical protein